MRRAENEDRPTPAELRDDMLLWVAVLLPLFASGINIVVGYTVAHWVSDVNHKTMAYLVSAIDFILCLCALAIGLNFQRRFSNASEDQPEAGRRYFMARLGILLSAFAILVIIASTLVPVILHPSD